MKNDPSKSIVWPLQNMDFFQDQSKCLEQGLNSVISWLLIPSPHEPSQVRQGPSPLENPTFVDREEGGEGVPQEQSFRQEAFTPKELSFHLDESRKSRWLCPIYFIIEVSKKYITSPVGPFRLAVPQSCKYV